MKKILLLSGFLTFLFFQKSFSQSERIPGPAEKKITDSLCVAINRLDMSKIGNGKEAISAFTDCFMKQSAMFEDVANERHADMADDAAMRQLGEDIAKNLLKEKCDGFLKLAVKMADKSANEDESTGSFTGTFKRIDLKGFNYFIVSDQSNSEKSFLWLKQFAGSEKFMTDVAKFAGKKIKISWQELEVYLPSAKGYYKVKEITAVDIL